MIVCFVSTV